MDLIVPVYYKAKTKKKLETFYSTKKMMVTPDIFVLSEGVPKTLERDVKTWKSDEEVRPSMLVINQNI